MADYLLFIDHDERGEFRAHVEAADGGASIFEFGTNEEGVLEMVEEGFLKHGRDLAGLTEYLTAVGMIERGSRVLDGYGYEPDDEDEDEDDGFDISNAVTLRP